MGDTVRKTGENPSLYLYTTAVLVCVLGVLEYVRMERVRQVVHNVAQPVIIGTCVWGINELWLEPLL